MNAAEITLSTSSPFFFRTPSTDPFLPSLPHSQETQRLVADSPPGISAIPHDDNLRYFDVLISGPNESPFEGQSSLLSYLSYFRLKLIRERAVCDRWYLQVGIVLT